MRLRFTAAVLFGAACCAAAATPSASLVSSVVRPVVRCDEIILNTKFPYRTDGYRMVLGTVAVPPSYLRQIVPTQTKPWAYWRKAGLVVRAGSPQVIVTVPRAWRSRATITWGNGSAGNHAVTLAIASCDGAINAGHAYAGGFYLRSSSACVPIVFEVGARRATVRFGLGRRC
jgi:hypothetical protein